MEVEMPEIEEKDSWGKFIALQVAILAVLLSVVTICAHRSHTATILLGNESSNEWSHYQAKRIRQYQLEMNTGLVKLLAPSSPEAGKAIAEYDAQRKKYDKDLEEIKAKADAKIEAGELAHHKSSYFDLSEGMLEIAMILSSLYFLTKKRSLSLFGLAVGAGGLFIGILGFLLH